MAEREIEIDVPDINVNPVPQVEAPEEPESMFQVYGPDDEVPTSEPEKSPAEIELEQLREQMATQQAESTTMQSGFAALTETLKDLKSQPTPNHEPVAPAPPPLDVEKTNEILKEKMFENPLEALAMAQNIFNKPQQDQTQAALNELKFETEKLRVLGNAGNAEIYSKYGAEVDQYAASLGKTAGSMEQAIAMVKGNHVEEIMAEKVDKLLEEKLGQMQAGQTQAQTNTNFTGVSNMPTPPAQRKTIPIKLNAEEHARASQSHLGIQAWAEREYAGGRLACQKR